MCRIWPIGTLAVFILGGCVPTPPSGPMSIADGPGMPMDQPSLRPARQTAEDVPQLGRPATQPENIPALGPLPGTQTSTLPGGTANVTPSGPSVPTTSVPSTGATTATTGGPVGDNFVVKPYPAAPGEVVIRIPSDAGDYGRIIQAKISEGKDLQSALTAAMAQAQKEGANLAKILSEFKELNPDLAKTILKPTPSGEKPTVTVLEVERR